MTRHLRRQGYEVGRKRVRRLMRQMGLTAIYRKTHVVAGWIPSEGLSGLSGRTRCGVRT